MKIGTITFHWANNYGAVLQAYALQQFLTKKGYDTEVIDYKPRKLYWRELIRDRVKNPANLKKRKKISQFVKKNIRLSHKKAYSSKKIAKVNNYDVVICGSDQIWNEWLLFHAEKEPCPAYYLGSVADGVKKISYAASFGTNRLQEKTQTLIQPLLKEFCGVSVRENTAIEILKEMHIPAVRVCDPTLLLSAEDYRALFANTTAKKRKVFPFILHKNQSVANDIVQYVKGRFNEDTDITAPLTVPEWLSAIDNCDVVVTNSFHATVFSILLHKRFIVLPVDGRDMNDRITTLLEVVGLRNRFCFNNEAVEDCLAANIDWSSVDKNIAEIRKQSLEWLLDCITT